MDASLFLERQDALREKLRRAVPRSKRAIELTAELKGLVNEQLREETGAEVAQKHHAEPVPEPPREFLDRVRQPDLLDPPRQPGPYAHTPYWVEQ